MCHNNIVFVIKVFLEKNNLDFVYVACQWGSPDNMYSYSYSYLGKGAVNHVVTQFF